MTTFRTLIVCSSLLFALNGCSKFSKTASEGYPGEHGWDPTVACAYMSDKLTPGTYKNDRGNEFGCRSEEKNLSAGSPPNSISYFATGEAGRARQVGLSLKVNEPERAGEALQTLLEYSQQLSERSIGIPLSTAAARAILAGNGGRGKVDTTKVEIVRLNFSDGKGYQLNYVITPEL